jgi:hypothetical protein
MAHALNPASQEVLPLQGEGIEKLQKNLLSITLLTGGLLAAGYLIDTTETKKQFFFSYLTAWTWALSLTLGALFWNLIHHVTAAGWSVAHRRIFENVTRTLPVLALLSLPLLGGLDSIYQWTHADDLKNGKQLWLSKPWFIARIFIYFGIWMLYAWMMRRGSLQMDRTGSASERKAILKRLEWYAPSGVLLLGLTATFAAFDIIMSLNYTWFSTIFGVIFWADSIRGSLSLLVLLILALRKMGAVRNVITSEHFHDIGKLMFGLTVFWAYVSFSQYFLYWYSNMPEETKFYLDRRHTDSSGLQPTTWYSLTILLAVCYFGVPFLLLLRRDCKRNPQILGFVAGWILFFQYFHLYWEIMPEGLKETVHSYPSSGVKIHWLDIAGVFFFSSVILNVVLLGMRKECLIPVADPRLGESLTHEVDEFGD